jgi:hypothetical protein
MTTRRRLIAAAPALLVAGCAGPQVADYVAERPLFLLERYFDGRVDAHGWFSDRAGRIVKRFTVAMACSWQGDSGVLDEDFTYSDGTRQRRVWRVSRLGGGRYEGRADDVVGVATGEASGNALRWNYTLALPVDGRVWHVDMDDWMFLLDERVLMNRTTMSKFGVRLGEVVIAFRRG